MKKFSIELYDDEIYRNLGASLIDSDGKVLAIWRFDYRPDKKSKALMSLSVELKKFINEIRYVKDFEEIAFI